MRFVFLPLIVVAAACGTTAPTVDDAGTDALAGSCCARGAQTVDMCGPVSAGGYSPIGGGACKTQSIPPCHHFHADTDHGCPIWVADDVPCDCDAGLVCPTSVDQMPLDVSGYTPKTIPPPRPPTVNACTMQQVADFAACYSGDTSKCAAFDPDASTCAACLVSQDGDASWGPLVLYGSRAQWNTAGCVDLVLGEVSAEPNSCGQKLHDESGCIDYAGCAVCTPFSADEATCDGIAAQNNCAFYAQTADAGCAALDGGSASSCFPDETIGDPTAQERDFITRLATFFCGPS